MAVGLGRAVPSVLVVEDDATVRRFLAENLIADRFAPMSAGTAEEALQLLGDARPDAALIDVGLPGMSGLDLIGAIRDGHPDAPWDSGLPILLLSGEASPHAAVRGIERGADDFVAKPFHYPEVLARLGALIRRSRGALVAEEVRVGALTIDRHGHVATLGGRRLELSAKEFALLDALARDPNRVVTKTELLRDVWGYSHLSVTRTVDNYIFKLRAHLEPKPHEPRYILTVHGSGYHLTT